MHGQMKNRIIDNTFCAYVLFIFRRKTVWCVSKIFLSLLIAFGSYALTIPPALIIDDIKLIDVTTEIPPTNINVVPSIIDTNYKPQEKHAVD